MAGGERSRVAQLRVAGSVAATLRDRILAGIEIEGSTLPTQDQLVQEFGVSYPSIREALRILETEGLVTVRRGNVGGAQVHRPDESSAAYHLGLTLQGGRVTLGDLAAGLQMLEPLCAGECARRSDRHEKIVPVLQANIATSEKLVGTDIAFTHYAREFHELIVAFTPNATVRYVVTSLVTLWSAQEEKWAESLSSQGEYPSEVDAAAVVRIHRRIVKEIVAGRAAEAERIARSHLAATQALLLERFDDGIVHAAATKGRLDSGGPSWRI
jgi:GntR family transcriptional repressor for pyruvate dehydrogenase complex